MEIKAVFRPDQTNDELDPLEEEPKKPTDLSGIPSFLQDRFPDVFDSRKATALPPFRETDHAIDLIDNQSPPYQRIYQLSPAEQAALDEFITDALAKGTIRESTSPAGAPILFVPKKDGTLRMCVDYRGLNAITVKNRYPLPLISELLDRLKGAQIFSKVDLKVAYYRIRIKEGDEWKTAFRTRYGHYEFCVMPFGLTNAPATFQSYINRALRGYIDVFCIVYMDDILIFSQNEEEHKEHLQLVMERLRQADLYANPKKCFFFQKEVEFLGFIIDPTGIRMDPSRVKAIEGWRDNRPQTYRDVQVFLGFCNFYRRFIFGFSRIARPLHDLMIGMKNGRKPGRIGAHWQEPQELAYNKLIDAFVTAPLLRHYDPTKPLRMETDASNYAMAGILSQPADDSKWHPIAYYSRKFSGAELQYPIYDKELMAIVMGFRHWRHYLEGTVDIEVHSDHENLSKFMAQTHLNGRQARWLIQLVPYDFQIFYRKGSLNPADAPSRRPDYMAGRIEDDSMLSQLLPSLKAKVACESPAMTGDASPNPAGPEVRSTDASDADQPNSGLRSRSVVTAGDPDAAKVVQLLASQTITRAEAKDALDGVNPCADGSPLLSQHLVELIRHSQELDPKCTRIMAEQELSLLAQDNDPAYEVVPGWSIMLPIFPEGPTLLCRNGLVYVPPQEALKAEILSLFHDCPSAGHWGARKTLDLIHRYLCWDGVEGDVNAYVASCPQCQGKAIHRHKPYGKLQPLPIPDCVSTSPFKEISLDWITGLPESRRHSTGESFNAILTIVDRLTKYALFIPTKDDTTAAQFAELFFEHVECRFGTPHGVVSDRDSRLTSEFWKAVCEVKMLKRRMSTAFHPQTDGQSEALNRIVEDYLRAYSADEPAAWVNLLPLAQYAYNNSRNHTTGKSPNWFMHGFDCEIRFHIADNMARGGIKAPAALDRVQKLHDLRIELRDKIAKAQERMAKYYNQRHVPKQFHVGDLVKLSTKNLRLKNRKLAPRWVGPFRVLERIGGQAYRLAFPDKYARLHDVFPVQLLEEYRARHDSEDVMPMPDLEDDEGEWEVEEVKDTARLDGKRHYLVKWLGWPAEYNTWEPEEHLRNARSMVTSFEKRLAAKRKGRA